MKAIVIQAFGGPENLVIQEISDPETKPDHVVITVKAFGVNHAETHMRKGEWAESVKVSGVECVGVVKADPSGKLAPGQKVFALMGGMGRTIFGSYAEQTCVPASNVVPFESDLAWAELAAIPESYATAWPCLFSNLELRAGQVLLLRGATSALGQAALNIAAHAGARVIATTRRSDRFPLLTGMGAEHVLIEGSELPAQVRALFPDGVDRVLDLVGNSVVLSSLGLVRRGGRVCEAGWLGGLAPIAAFNPLLQMPSGVHFSLFGSFMFGLPGFPLSEVPFQTIVDHVANGTYRARPARIFRFDEIQAAHRLMESNEAGGKIVVTL